MGWVICDNVCNIDSGCRFVIKSNIPKNKKIIVLGFTIKMRRF